MIEPRQNSGLGGFLRENWLYIAGPLIVILLGLLALVLFGDDTSGGFFYNIF